MTAPSTEQPPPSQEQEYPGRTAEMDPRPRDDMRDYEGRGLMAGARALITGGDSGIGRAVAPAFAREGSDVAIAYLSEIEDSNAARTAELVEAAGRRCVTIRGDLAIEDNCQRAVEQTVTELGGLDVLVNDVATQEPVDDLAELSTGQWEWTFLVNVHSYFWTTRAAHRHLPGGGAIINTSSINGLRGNKTLIDYAATKGAILALTYSLAQALRDRGIRVNSVAPGPVWTPLIPPPSARKRPGRSAARCPWGAPLARTRSPRPTSSSPTDACPATTQERSSPPSVAKPSPGKETGMGIALVPAAVAPVANTLGGQGWRQTAELGMALLLSGAIGLEREVRHKDAGLRTHILVGVGAALFMLISKYGFTDVLENRLVVLDPSRMAAQIVSGIGFIGAGLIFVRRDAVRGLTTAASIWVTAAVGSAAGAGLLILAAEATGIYVVVTLVLPVARRHLPLAAAGTSTLRAVTLHVHGKRPVTKLTELDHVDAIIATSYQPADE